MSKIKNGGLDQYGAEPFEQQQFITAGIEGVKALLGLACNEGHCSAVSVCRLVSRFCFRSTLSTSCVTLTLKRQLSTVASSARPVLCDLLSPKLC